MNNPLSLDSDPSHYQRWETLSQTKQAWFHCVSNKATRHLDIYLYGVIGGRHANLQDFLSELRQAGKVNTITVYLNTVGGVFYHGLPIFNTLKQHPAHVTVKVMGYALSMGSVIMLAGDRIEAAENALIMIHRAQGGTRGSADDMLKMADALQKHEAALMPEYQRRLNKSETDIHALLAAETWYTATEAQQAGLVDALINTTENHPTTVKQATPNPEAQLHFIQQHYHKVPAHISNAYPLENEDDNMTPQDLQALIQAVKTAINEAHQEVIQQLSNPAQNTAEQEALQASHDRLAQENEDLRQQVASLSRVDPNKSSPTPVNTGPVDEGEAWQRGFL